MSDQKPTRLDQMDYLRGLAALGIMCYHYGWWWLGIHFESDDFLGVIGIYGVSVFYVLSGFTLQWVYGSRIKVDSDWKLFFRKRFFRIYPLFVLVTILTLATSKIWPDWRTMLYNFTGVFGFFAWDRSIAAGGWSIGNELVFYALFPLLIVRSARVQWTMALFFLITTGVHIYFAFDVLQAELPIVEQHVDPFNVPSRRAAALRRAGQVQPSPGCGWRLAGRCQRPRSTGG
ncbi:MAG: acyltransferase family protein, partial [Flavobacteriales bacterium]